VGQEEFFSLSGGHISAEDFFEALENFLMRHHGLPGKSFF
jgi:hypothetical protein